MPKLTGTIISLLTIGHDFTHVCVGMTPGQKGTNTSKGKKFDATARLAIMTLQVLKLDSYNKTFLFKF